MDRPCFSILAHPTGRLLEAREPYDVDMLKIVRQARERGCFLELNAHPERLDLLDIHCQMAKDEGVLVAISSDAHRLQDFDNLKYGHRPGATRLAREGRRAQHPVAQARWGRCVNVQLNPDRVGTGAE